MAKYEHRENARYSCTSFRGIRKVAASPDHLVRLEEDRWGEGKAQRRGAWLITLALSVRLPRVTAQSNRFPFP
jgi:hypothetical protein